MSLDNKQEIWLELARPEFPDRTDEQLMALSMYAASMWYYPGPPNKLTELYDKYVMLKTLKGIKIDGNE